MIPQACDIGLIYQPGVIFSEVENHFTEKILQNEKIPPAWAGVRASHALIVVDYKGKLGLLEAIEPFMTISPIDKYDKVQYLFARPIGISDYDRGRAVGYGIGRFKGKPYAAGKLVLEALDGEFDTTAFARILGIPALPICSVSVADILAFVGFLLLDPRDGKPIPVQATTPNAILANVLTRPSEFLIVSTNIVQGGTP
jgi:hypothetical protein